MACSFLHNNLGFLPHILHPSCLTYTPSSCPTSYSFSPPASTTIVLLVSYFIIFLHAPYTPRFFLSCTSNSCFKYIPISYIICLSDGTIFLSYNSTSYNAYIAYCISFLPQYPHFSCLNPTFLS